MTGEDSQSEGCGRAGARGRARVSDAEREALLDEFETGGASAAAFARAHGLSYVTFSGWVRRRRAGRAGAGPGRPLFAEVVVAGPALRVALPGGAVVEVAEVSQVGLAAGLIRELAARC